MLKINYQNECFLCGELNINSDNICDHCKGNSSFIQTEQCSTCGQPLISEISECMRCRNSDFHFQNNRSLFEYKNTSKEIFYQYKFKKNRKIGLWYSFLLSEIIIRDFADYLIIPSPYRYLKKVRKGWDQVEYLTNILKKKYHLNVLKVLRKKGTIDQKKLNINQRKENLSGCIIFNNKYLIKDKKILFIDDVFTTGATANECAKVLLEHKAQLVSVLTIAID